MIRGSTAAGAGGKRSGRSRLPTIADLVSAGDFTAASVVANFYLRSDGGDEGAVDGSTGFEREWIAYCDFHLGKFDSALKHFEDVKAAAKSTDVANRATLHMAMCMYKLGQFVDAQNCAATLPDSPGKNRLLFHIANRLGDENTVFALHRKFSDKDVLDQLSLASLQAARAHYSEAIDIYKRIIVENRDASALNVYMALCYYKLDYYDVSQDVLKVYLQSQAPSILAYNIKACNTFRLVSGKAAEAELRALADAGITADSHDLVKHNLVVFRNGDGALRVLPSLLNTVVPEARLNLVIHHLRSGNVAEAYELMQDATPALPPEYIVQAVCHTLLAQQPIPGLGNVSDHLRSATQLYHVVGSSTSECDTIPGRQAMASNYFLLKQFEDVNIYLSSIKQYMYSDDDFNWNYGLSLAATGNYKEAEETLLLVQNPAYTSEAVYLNWLTRCYIMNRKARQAWELYLKTNTTTQSIQLLQIIANDCYKVGAFLYAAKAFDNLERLDEGDPEYWEGKRGACIGVFQQVIAGTESKESLREVLVMLRNTSNPQVEYITRTISRWAQASGGI